MQKTLRPVRPNAGIEAAYRKKLDSLIDQMQRSIVWWVTSAYKANKPEMAADAAEDDPRSKWEQSNTPAQQSIATELSTAIRKSGSPAKVLDRVMGKLSKHWQAKFDQAAPDLAKYFATKAKDRTDAILKAALKKSGFAVEFKMTASMNDVMQATIAENVQLISNLAEQHIAEVQGAVMRSVAAGRDITGLANDLQKRLGITKRRATLIARDQNNKMNSNINRVRQMDMGIKTAIWIHSAGGKEPRHDHVEANGKEYDIATGEFLDGFKLKDGSGIFPGQLINCRCVSKAVIPGLKRA